MERNVSPGRYRYRCSLLSNYRRKNLWVTASLVGCLHRIRRSLVERNITACIPPRKNRKSKPSYNWHLYKKRHLIENMFAKLKDWRRVATRYDRCAHTFMSAIQIAASFIFYLKE
ncbi:transposase [Komagataeibacter swingsii]|uniref:transposase n=1 Tax=Komagataeibacter swingsii TaxID=215220 RepID=UPI0038CFA5BF